MKSKINTIDNNSSDSKQENDSNFTFGTQPELNEHTTTGSQQINNFQRQYGNMATLKLFQETMLAQTELQSDQGQDVFEAEADQVAENTLDAQGEQPRLTHTGIRIQRTPAGDNPAPTTSQPSATQTDLAAARPSLIVEDTETELQPNQMRKSEFLSQLRTSVCAAAETALAGTMFSAMGCPWIDHWFNRYSTQNGRQLEATICRFVPAAGVINSARDYIPLITNRVRQSIETWSNTGQITGLPEGFSVNLPGSSGFLAGLASSDSSILRGAGSVISGIGRLLFKTRDNHNSGSSTDPHQIQSQLGSGHSLDSGVQSRMGSVFRQDFSNVRIHTDANAGNLSRDLNARAFTIGQDIAFGAGEYQPGSLVGDALIAHELAHTIQQGEGKSEGTIGFFGEHELEEEADISAVTAMEKSYGGLFGRLGTVTGNVLPKVRSGLRLQRCSKSTTQISIFPTYRTSDLLAKLEGSDTVSQINTYLGILSSTDRSLAIGDLQSMRVGYANIPEGNRTPTQERALEKADQILQDRYLAIVQSQSSGILAPVGGHGATPPGQLLTGTRSLSATERTEVQEALTPEQEVNPITGVTNVFVEDPPAISPYEGRIRTRVNSQITNFYDTFVVGRGVTEHGDPTKVISWPTVMNVSQAAADEVHNVFSGYVRGNGLSRGTYNPVTNQPNRTRGSVFDVWELEQAEQSSMSPSEKRDKAKKGVEYIINSDDEIRKTITSQHLLPSNTLGITPGPRDRDDIHDGIVTDVINTAGMVQRLCDIDRGWPGMSQGGIAMIQRFRGLNDPKLMNRLGGNADIANRYTLWDMFQTMIHEYLHVLTNTHYQNVVESRYPYDSSEYNTLIEGINSLMTEIVWRNVAPRTSGQPLRNKVEGSVFAAQPPDPSTIPDITNQRYSSYAQAMELVNIVGIRNVYAAYFLGKTDLIGL